MPRKLFKRPILLPSRRMALSDMSFPCKTYSLFPPQLTTAEHDHCLNCTTKKEEQYEFPLSERDIGTSLKKVVLNAEIPPDHERVMGGWKGDWVCMDCGHANGCTVLDLMGLIGSESGGMSCV